MLYKCNWWSLPQHWKIIGIATLNREVEKAQKDELAQGQLQSSRIRIGTQVSNYKSKSLYYIILLSQIAKPFFQFLLIMSYNIFIQFYILFTTGEFLFLISSILTRPPYLIIQTLEFFNAFLLLRQNLHKIKHFKVYSWVAFGTFIVVQPSSLSNSKICLNDNRTKFLSNIRNYQGRHHC